MRERVASQLIGPDVQAGDLLPQERLRFYAAAVAGQSPGTADARATGPISSAVRTQAYVDGFLLVAAIMAAALVPVALLRPAPPGPATPPPLLSPWRRA